MFRLWGKEFKDNRMLKDLVICDESDDTRTHKIFHALDEICYKFDLSKPLWIPRSMNLNAIRVLDFIRILSLMKLSLIILKFRSLRNNCGMVIILHQSFLFCRHEDFKFFHFFNFGC